jgi:MscS family membrane protein
VDKILDFYRMQADESLFFYWVKEILVAAFIFGIFWGLSHVLRYLLSTVAPRFVAYTGTDLGDRILKRITPPASWLVVFSGLYYAAHSLPLPNKAHLISSGAIFVAIIVIFANMAFRMFDEVLNWYGIRVAERTGGGPDRQVLPLVEKVFVIFLVGAALIVILKHFGYDVLSLVTALGIGSLAIGMAAKDTLANMISGFTLMIDRPFRIGDRIQLAGGQWGDVVDVGLRSTKIKTADNTLLIIPNSELCNSTVVNMAFPDIKGKGRINVGIGYGSNVELVKSLLVQIAREVTGVLQDPPPEAYFVSFGDCALNMSLFFWVDDYNKVFSTSDQLNTLIITRFRDAGIEIPYPTRTVLLEKEG